MFYVYILQSEVDGNIYTGLTSNLKARIQNHQLGKVKSTALRRPLKLVYYEAHLAKSDALKRKIYLKNGGKAKNTLKLQIEESLKL